MSFPRVVKIINDKGSNNISGFANVKIDSCIVAEIAIGDNLYINVNFDNRIITKGLVKRLSHDKFLILPYNGDLFSAINADENKISGTVEATIDGKKYSGSKIIVDKKAVFVDGKSVAMESELKLAPESLRFNLTPPLTRLDKELIKKANDLLVSYREITNGDKDKVTYCEEQHKYLAVFMRKLTISDKEKIQSLITELSEKLMSNEIRLSVR